MREVERLEQLASLSAHVSLRIGSLQVQWD